MKSNCGTDKITAKLNYDLAFFLITQSLNKHRNHWRSQHLDSNVTMVSRIHNSAVGFFPVIKSVVNLALQFNVTTCKYYHVFSSVSSRQQYFTVLTYFYLLQPKSEDEEGWKKFCLGEKVYSEIDALSDNENLGIDYIKVSIGLLSNFQLLFSRVAARNNPTVYYHFVLNRKQALQ